jgi:DNA-binding CsgD family transcriptional regulator
MHMGQFDQPDPNGRTAQMVGELERGRQHYGRRAWADAYESLALADQAAPLGGEDLELLAMAAYLIGRDDDYLKALERAHQARLDADERLRAARCAFWLGLRLFFRGEEGRATGWLARAQRLLEHQQHECAEQGYLLLWAVEQQLAAGDYEAAYATAVSAVEIGERCGDADLIACARHDQGKIRIQQGQVEKGLALLDEVMVAVTAAELSSLVTGLMYCAVIQVCQEVYAFGRAREWTAALAQWCEEQPEMVAFTGVCRVHRAEIMQLRGAWQEAIEEAQRVRESAEGVVRLQTVAAALYQQAEVHRLRGEFAAAEEAYRSTSQWGLEPQPGLALLRLGQGRTDAAVAATRRAMSATADPLQRAKLLPAHVEITLAANDIQEARGACAELEEIAGTFDTGVLGAMAGYARGAVELAEGNPHAALGSLRCAFEVWQRIDAPYAAARVRVLIGLACHALGDEDGASLEIDAAQSTFERLGAAPDLARIDSLTKGAPSGHAHGLTPRELQVLRLVAAGDTNKAIAAELCLSERTIERHLSNIFTKLDISTRAAATAWAYEHDLI